MKNYQYGPVGNTYGGQGIKHVVTDIVNRQLALTPMLSGAPTPVIEDGNHFWNCPTGVFASNVYEVDDNWSIFRSTRSATLASATIPMPGDTGISYHTNRFNLSVMEGQFNNINTGIYLETDPTCSTPYSVAAGTSTGICADAVYIYHNYFGAEPTSTTPYSSGSANSSEYMSDAIILTSPNTNCWFNLPNGFGGNNHEINILSNKIDRAFRGVNINGMWDMPAAVQHNSVNIEDDYTFNGGGSTPTFGYGIAVQNKLSHVSVNNNTLTGQYVSLGQQNTVSLVYCNFLPNGGASVTCNMASNAHFGFEFSDYCDQTTWFGNFMCDDWAGMALTGNGQIGPQGAPNGTGCANKWATCSSMFGQGIAPNHTYVDGSNPLNSPLYCVTGSSIFNPTSNWFSTGSTPYSALSINNPIPASNNLGGDCWALDPFANSYPLWRAISTTGIDELNTKTENKEIVIVPNPTTGKISIIKGSELDILTIKMLDISGKTVEFPGRDNGSQFEMDLAELAEGIYLIEINVNNQNKYHKKIIKIN